MKLTNSLRRGARKIFTFLAEYGSVSDLLKPKNWLLEWSMGGGRRTQAGESISPQSALGISAYYACLRAISEDIAKLPLILYHREPRGKSRAREHSLYPILHDQANPDMGSMEFRQLLQHWACGWGNGYAEIAQVSGRPGALYPIHPSRVQIVRFPENPNIRVYRVQNDDGSWVGIPSSQMFHLRGLGDENGGYSVARIAAESLGLSMAAQTFSASFFGNSASLCGVLSHPASLSPEARKLLRNEWTELYGGPYAAGKPAILEEGMKWERIGIPPDNAQLIESRQFQIEEICRWFRMPPHKIQHLLRSTFSNISHQAIEYVVDTLTPWFTRWEQEIQRKLLVGEPDYFAEHLALGLLRGDDASRIAFYNGMFMIGAMSQNDIREAENFNWIGPEGDVYYVPLNMIRSKDAAEGKRGEPTPTPSDNSAPEVPPDMMPDEEPPEDGNEPPAEENANVLTLQKARVAEISRGLLGQVLDQIFRKEENAATRAEEKFAGNRPGFGSWIDSFFNSRYVAEVSEILRPTVSAVCEIAGSPEDSDRILFLIVNDGIEGSREKIRDLFNENKIAVSFHDYASQRKCELIEKFMQEVIDAPCPVE